ncbi:MAG: CAP domain-containing protein, partial [Gaiellaceae bacterium]
MPRSLVTLVAVLLCVLAAAAARPDPARAITTMEKRLVARINDARAARGVRRLRIGPRIQRGAHDWAGHLIRADAFYHGRLAAGTSENIAWGNCR